MDFTVGVTEHKKGIPVISPKGNLDTDSTEILKDKLRPYLNGDTKVLVFEMGELEYIASAGLAAVLNARKVLEARGGKVLVVGMTPPIKRVFDIIKALPPETILKNMVEIDSCLENAQRSK